MVPATKEGRKEGRKTKRWKEGRKKRDEKGK